MSVSGGNNILKKELIVYLNLYNENSYQFTNRYWNDLSGNNNFVNIQSASYDASGSILFQPSQSGIWSFGKVLLPNVTNNISIEFIYKKIGSSNGAYHSIIHNINGRSNRTILLLNDNGNIYFEYATANNSAVGYSFSNVFTTNEIIYITFVKSDQGIFLYKNGNLIDSNSSHSTDMLSGVSNTYLHRSTTYLGNGYLYSLRVYNKKLSNEEVLNNYLNNKFYNELLKTYDLSLNSYVESDYVEGYVF